MIQSNPSSDESAFPFSKVTTIFIRNIFANSLLSSPLTHKTSNNSRDNIHHTFISLFIMSQQSPFVDSSHLPDNYVVDSIPDECRILIRAHSSTMSSSNARPWFESGCDEHPLCVFLYKASTYPTLNHTPGISRSKHTCVSLRTFCVSFTYNKYSYGRNVFNVAMSSKTNWPFFAKRKHIALFQSNI